MRTFDKYGKKFKIIYYQFIIVFAGIIVYFNSFQGDFIFDDEAVIIRNSHIEKIWPLFESFSAPPHSPVRDRPVINLTFTLNYLLGGRSPFGYHLVNLSIHLITALLVFSIIRRTILLPECLSRYKGVATGLALASALIWEVHPLQTQSITYITQRCESLMGLFYLGVLYTVIRGSLSRNPVPWYLFSICLCGLGMGSKAVMVTAPLMVLIYDRIFLSRSWYELWNKRRLLYFALAATWVIQFALVTTTSYDDIKTHLPLDYAMSQLGVIVYYLKLILVPYPLCLDYYWPIAQGYAEIIPPALLIGVMMVLTVWGLVKNPPLGFAGVWFLLILGPTSSILPLEDLAFEHRLYLPLISVVTVVTVGGYEILLKLFPSSAQSRKNFGVVLTMVIVTGLGILTIRRNADYRSAEAMWRDVIRKRPDNPRAYNNLGNLINKKEDEEGAFALYQSAIRADPGYYPAYYNLANMLARKGKLEEAADYYRKSLELNPDGAEVHNNLAVVLFKSGMREEAIGHLRESIRIDSSDPSGYYNLGVMLIKEDRTGEALPFLEKALELCPGHLPARQNIDEIIKQSGG